MQVKRSGSSQISQEDRDKSQPLEPEPSDSSSQDLSLLERWYRLTTPSLTSLQTSLEKRELLRRARLASVILLLAVAALLLALPVSLANHGEFLPLSGALITCCLALFLNRLGRTYLTALIVIIGSDMGFIVSILAAPNGLTAYTLPLFDLLVIGELIAVSLLPAWSVFLVALIHSIFIWTATAYMPHSDEISHTLATAGYGVIVRPVILQLFVAVIAYLWVKSSMRAMLRADRAEEIMALQNSIAQQKQALESGIDQILQMHIQISNGDFNISIPVSHNNALWRIASSLNMLTARLQRLNRADHELHRVKEASDQLILELQRARLHRLPVHVQRSDTLLDPLLQEINDKHVE